jgi:RNA polymerase sigma-70 factor (ECF subfamily)
VALRADDVDLDRDAALVERFQTGDEEAFADLYRRYFGRLRRYCLRRLGDPHDAEEAAQEALVKAYRALPSFGGDRRFYPWLRVIAANVCTDRCKRKPVAAPADATGGDVVVDSVFDAMDQAFVRAALRELNPRYRAALSLWAEGHASREIADELGCSTGAVDVTLHRARQSFRARFLAISGEGKLGVVGLGALPTVGRWAQRWRARIVTRIADHPDLVSPLATKIAAGAIAFTVVGGAVATVPTSHPVSPTAPPTSIVSVQTAPTSAVSSAPASVAQPDPTTARQSDVPARPSTPPATTAATPPSAAPPGPVQFTSNDDAQRSTQNAPVKAQAGGVFLHVDPAAAVDGIRSQLQGK